MWRIELEVSRQACRFLDPTRGFEPDEPDEPDEKTTEIRGDPLAAGHTTHDVADMGFEPERPDVEQRVARARAGFDPFAPDDERGEVTRRSLAEAEEVLRGRLPLGEALVAPNLFPYDRYSAVTIPSKVNFVPLSGFSKERLSEAIQADLGYLKRVRQVDGEGLRHCRPNGNYLQLAGSSIVHPHHQRVTSPVPADQLRKVEAGLSLYGGDYLGDLPRLDEGGERWVGGEGSILYLTAFAPPGRIDVVGVLVGRSSNFDLTAEDVGALSRSLLRIFAYLQEEDLASFNFALYGLEGADGFTVHCRLSPPFLLSNALGVSDVNYLDISPAEPPAFFYPEAAASSLRPRFENPESGGAR